MSAWIGAALALAVGHNGTNGLDPSAIYLIKEAAGDFKFDETAAKKFVDWLKVDVDERASAVGYFVTCAFDSDTTISLTSLSLEWKGVFGLAASAQSLLTGLPLRSKGGEQIVLKPEEGMWVSACLMAHANTQGSHEYISLRGNPPGPQELWKPTPGERWAMGYTEGVFFADLINFNFAKDGAAKPLLEKKNPTRADLERSFTQSLNLPAGYDPGKWRPSNASLGRTLDFEAKTTVTANPVGTYRAARRLGAFHGRLPPAAADPDYGNDKICVRPGDDAAVVDCGVLAPIAQGGETWRPLFVHAPRLVNLESVEKLNFGLTMQALREGTFSREQVRPCQDGEPCIGSFGAASVRGGATDVAEPRKPALLVNLHKDQGVVVVLRFVSKNEPEDLCLNMNEDFTAIVRYTSKRGANAIVEVGEAGGWRKAEAVWAPTDGDFQWLQVYPVRPFTDAKHSNGQVALKIRIRGVGDGSNAPGLDVAGFVPGRPWCLDDARKTFASACQPVPGGGAFTIRRPLKR